MEENKNIGLESPANLQWLQGAKNTRIIQHGTPEGETTTTTTADEAPSSDGTDTPFGTPLGETLLTFQKGTKPGIGRKVLFSSVGPPLGETNTQQQKSSDKRLVTDKFTEVGGEDIFLTKSKITRSPVSNNTPPTFKDGYDPWQDECIKTSPVYNLTVETKDPEKKRKRIESPLLMTKKSNDDMAEVNKVLAKVVKRTGELKKLVNESTKTKLEIKQVARELDQLVSTLEKKVKEYQMYGEDEIKIIKPTTDKGTQTTPENSRVTSIGIQVESDEIDLEKQKVQKNTYERIHRALEVDTGFQSVSEILDEEWPPEFFKKTKEVPLGVNSLNSSGDFVLIWDPQDQEQKEIIENLAIKYPEMEYIMENNEGQIDYIINKVVTKTRNQENIEKTTALYILPIETTKQGLGDIEEVYKLLKLLKGIIPLNPTDNINIIVNNSLKSEYVKKLCEYVFVNNKLNITLMSSKSDAATKRNPKTRHHTEKLLIKTGETSYADLLKTVKDEVDINKMGVQVKSIRKTMKGDLLLEVVGDRQKAGVFQSAIKEKVNNDVRIANNTTTIHVLDIDAATTQKEVEDAINGTLGNRAEGAFTVSSMRPMRDGNQIATIRISKYAANLLIKVGRIRIGWVKCRIRERITVLRCFRCLEFGHKRQECTGPDRSDICIRCNKPGHKAIDCKGAPFCPSCQTKEHRADTTKCPKFRQLIKLQTGSTRSRAGTQRNLC